MKKFIKVFSFAIVFFTLLSFGQKAKAQCAMCQATVESSIDNGDNTAKGLNNGIIYLLAAPYVAMLGIGVLWYKKYRKKDIIIDMKKEKINLN